MTARFAAGVAARSGGDILCSDEISGPVYVPASGSNRCDLVGRYQVEGSIPTDGACSPLLSQPLGARVSHTGAHGIGGRCAHPLQESFGELSPKIDDGLGREFHVQHSYAHTLGRSAHRSITSNHQGRPLKLSTRTGPPKHQDKWAAHPKVITRRA